jgi:heterodisulfide reductase subunit A-like polyferredoxin
MDTWAGLSDPLKTDRRNGSAPWTAIMATGGPTDRKSISGSIRGPIQNELEKAIKQDGKIRSLNPVVMIQCVGSRNRKSYCSRVCCGQAGQRLRLKPIRM